MALKDCKECGKSVSTEASACPHCGYPMTPAFNEPKKHIPPRGYTPPVTAKKSSTGWATKVLIGMVVLVGAFLALGATVGNTPEAKAKAQARSVINLCWDDQKRKSFDPATQRFIASTCEKMESDFTQKYGVKP